MSSPISDAGRDLLARSFALVHAHQDGIVRRVELHLRGAGGESEPDGRSDAAATFLVLLLLDEARSLVETGGIAAAPGLRDEHRALGIDGRHYSRFGDVLSPILRDALGESVPAEVVGAWCDAFWAVVRHLELWEQEATA